MNEGGLEEWQEGPGFEVPGIRIPRAGREDLALGQVGVVGDDEIRANCALVSLVWQRRRRVNDRERRRSHVDGNRITGNIKSRVLLVGGWRARYVENNASGADLISSSIYDGSSLRTQ